MQLSEYIKKIGDSEAAKLFRVPERVVVSWRYKARRPRPKKALEIIRKSPVTMEGIYGA